MTDSDCAKDEESRKSISRALHTMGEMITGWSSKMQATATLSTTEAEYIAMSYCCQEVKFQKSLIEELVGFSIRTSTVFSDNNAAMFLTRNHQVSQRMEHIDVRHHWIRELQESSVLTVKFVGTDYNTADLFTKKLSVSSFERHHRTV